MRKIKTFYYEKGKKIKVPKKNYNISKQLKQIVNYSATSNRGL